MIDHQVEEQDADPIQAHGPTGLLGGQYIPNVFMPCKMKSNHPVPKNC